MSARNTRVFETRLRNGVLEVWLPPVDHPEGEMVLAIAPSYLPALIATLKNCADGGTCTPNASRQGRREKTIRPAFEETPQ